MEETLNKTLEKTTAWLQEWGIEPWMATAGAATLFLLLIILLLTRKRQPRSSFPGLLVNLFQIAPLGRDAFLKIKNPAGPVTLSQYKVIGRNDVMIKNHLSGHRLETDKEYSILLEASGTDRIEPNFSLQLTYITEQGQVFQQKLLPGQQRVEPPKRISR